MGPHPPLYTIIEDTMADRGAEQALARDIIAVHGTEAAIVARQNARAAALAGQLPQAKSWIRVLGNIQRQQAGPAAVVTPAAVQFVEIPAEG